MRISDWSSDVCSSDLKYRTRECLTHLRRCQLTPSGRFHSLALPYSGKSAGASGQPLVTTRHSAQGRRRRSLGQGEISSPCSRLSRRPDPFSTLVRNRQMASLPPPPSSIGRPSCREKGGPYG